MLILHNACGIATELRCPQKNNVKTGNTTNTHNNIKLIILGYFVSPPDIKMPNGIAHNVSITIQMNCSRNTMNNCGYKYVRSFFNTPMTDNSLSGKINNGNIRQLQRMITIHTSFRKRS